MSTRKRSLSQEKKKTRSSSMKQKKKGTGVSQEKKKNAGRSRSKTPKGSTEKVETDVGERKVRAKSREAPESKHESPRRARHKSQSADFLGAFARELENALEELEEKKVDELGLGNTIRPIELEDSTLYANISSADNVATLDWFIRGDSKLARMSLAPRGSSWSLPGWLVTTAVSVGKKPRFEEFYSRLANDTELKALATEEELRAIRGLASRSFCYLLRLLVEKGKLGTEQVLLLEASGDIPGLPMSGLVHFYENTFGFTLTPDQPERSRIQYKKMEATVGHILERCTAQAEI